MQEPRKKGDEKRRHNKTTDQRTANNMLCEPHLKNSARVLVGKKVQE
jgi:hypothetical protein